jgi:hypothetical protein
MPGPSEQHIQHAIIQALRSRGCYVVKVIAASVSGVPDLICCYRGQFIAFEVKRRGQEPTAKQLYEMGAIEMGAGGVAKVVHSAKEAIDALDSAFPATQP